MTRRFAQLYSGLAFLFLVVAFTFTPTLSIAQSDDKPEKIEMQTALRLVEIMENTWEQTDDYTVITYKKERHGGGLTNREKIFTKFKRPFSVYMKWVEDDPPEHKNPNLGQEMIFEKGWNNDKIYSHLGERSFLPSAITSLAGYYYDYEALDPQSRAATYYQRHTIDEVPYGDIIKRISTAVRGGIENPDDGVYFVNRGYRNVFGSPSGCIEGYLPGDKRDIYYDDRVLVCVDLRSNMPSQIVVHNDAGQILENYRMRDITLNPGLKQEEFRPNYPEYNFE